jgi:hypothetical protein
MKKEFFKIRKRFIATLITIFTVLYIGVLYGQWTYNLGLFHGCTLSMGANLISTFGAYCVQQDDDVMIRAHGINLYSIKRAEWIVDAQEFLRNGFQRFFKANKLNQDK